MPINQLTIRGYRGFSKSQTLRFAQPNGGIGSGLTILVGPNNGGKSTIVEALNALATETTTSFSEGKRNKRAQDRVLISAKMQSGEVHELKTVDTGGSEIIRKPESSFLKCYVLQSRRYFAPFFSEGTTNRQHYIQYGSAPSTRGSQIEGFSMRLFAALRNRTRFDEVLSRVLSPVPQWTIEQANQGSYYLKINYDGQSHTSDGLGEGIVSLLFLIDSLYDSSTDEMIVVDEPELSLHPAYQRRLARLLAEYAKDRQIVYSTHSPQFVDFKYILNGAEVARVHKAGPVCTISQVRRNTLAKIEGITSDINNPHVLGIEARETFFQDDGVVVVEGQEDVVLYPVILEQLNEEGLLNGVSPSYIEDRLFGWGAGGAAKIEAIVALLHDLGFNRIAAIFDANESSRISNLQEKFPNYHFGSIPADDVRSKAGVGQQSPIYGLLDENYYLRSGFKEKTAELFSEVGEYLQGQ